MDSQEIPVDETSLNIIQKRLNRIMFRMYQEFPFWAFLVEKCKIKVVPENDAHVPTAAIDRNGNIYFNAKFAENCSDAMMHFVLAHEVMHMLLGHFDRQGSRNPLLWNIAGDILINSMLANHFAGKGIHVDLSEFCTADKFQVGLPDEVVTETVYDQLMQNTKQVTISYEQLMNGNPSDMLPGGVILPGVCIRENSETTPTNEKEWSEAGLESATRARMAGNCPGFMERMVDALNNPKVPWNEVLAYYLRQRFCQNTRNRHTFTPPNRRYLYQDLIITSRVGTKKPQLAFSIDTSGSMSAEDISKGVAEMNSIRKLYKVPLYLIECDTQVHNAKWISPYEEIPKVTGGGGTSFVPVMEHITNKNVDIDVLVFFTDGYGDFGPAPEFDVIWIMSSDVIAPYGKTIKIG